MLRLADEFCGGGGSMTGWTAVPYVQGVWAGNHDQTAIDTHAANFPDVEHYRGDIEDADLTKVPPAELFWASPVCPPWTDARGRRRDFDRSTQPPLFGPHGPDEKTARGRALMEQVHLLVPYTRTGVARPVTEPVGTFTTHDRYLLTQPGQLEVDETGIDPADIDIDDVYARMLTVDEIKAGMAFPTDFKLVAGSGKKKVSLLGRAVTPPVAEDLGAALVEAIAGHDLPEPAAAWAALSTQEQR